MLKKTLKSLFCIYVVQLIFLACEVDDCNCPPVKTYERIYNGLSLNAWDTSESQVSEIDETVDKNSFALSISIKSELEQITSELKKTDFSGFGFAFAHACSCIPEEFINVDPIDDILITVTDTLTNEITDVTDNFTTYGHDGQQLAVSELFKNPADGNDGFQVYLFEYDNIPDISIFAVKIILVSGTELIERTQEINFE